MYRDSFWTKEKGYKLYVNGLMGNKARKLVCPEDCVSVKMMDGNCDQEKLILLYKFKVSLLGISTVIKMVQLNKECNTLACNWDGDDCDGLEPEGGATDHRPAFYQGLSSTYNF